MANQKNSLPVTKEVIYVATKTTISVSISSNLMNQAWKKLENELGSKIKVGKTSFINYMISSYMTCKCKNGI